MTGVWLFYLVTTVILVKGRYSLPSSGPSCENSLAPPTDARGVNRLGRGSNIPLFQLSVDSQRGGNLSSDQSMNYRVDVSAVNDQFPFSEVRITIATSSPCGAGSLTFDPHHFLDDKQSGSTCPRVVLTNRKQPMTDLPHLTWTPPACGCVQFRAVVISLDNVYYSDNEDVENGPLTQTICVQQKASRELYLGALCHVQARYSAAEIISRSSFQQRHQVEVGWMDKHGLEMGLELRRSDNTLCCNKHALEDKLTCFDDSRRRRVDKFCEDGYPDIPLTSFRLSHMRDREKECCFLLGEHRYTCFAEKSDLIQGPSVTLLDFSQDETDPVNDLAEFASVQDVDVVKSIGAIAIGGKENNDNINSEENDEDGLDEDDKEEVDETMKKHSVRQPPHTKVQVKPDSDKSTVDGSRGSSSVSRSFPALKEHGPGEDKRTSTKVAPENEKHISSSSERRKKTRHTGESLHRSSGERNNNNNNNRKASSQEYTPDGRRASGERTDGRRASGERTDGRRASGERTARKRGSAEKLTPAPGTYPWGPGYGETYPRGGTGQSRERELASSAERRARVRASGQRRHDWPEVVTEPDFEDQGGKSVEVTLDILQRKIERLHIKHQCCEAGSMAGQLVYGWRSPVQKECEHSRHKYISVIDITSGRKSCLDQFLQCCMEQAVSGPVVSSSEFRDKQFKHNNNLKKSDSRGERGEYPGLPAGKGLQREELSRDDVPRFESPEAYELASERRFQSMREYEQDPQDNDEEETNGPKKFDETDNNVGNNFDILDRKDDTVDNDDDFDEKDVTAARNVDESGESKGSVSNEQKKHRKESDNKRAPKKGNIKKEVAKHQLDRASDLDEGMENQERDASRSNEDLFRAKTSSGKSRNYKHSRAGGKSSGGRSSARDSRQRASRESWASSQERRQFAQMYYNTHRAYKAAPSGKIGAQDSQEMAAAHARRKFIGNLDSKEMVDAYRKKAPEKMEPLNDGPKLRLPKRKQHRKQRGSFRN